MMPENAQRDRSGRFLPGCRPGPGNPESARSQRRMAVFRGAISDEDIEALARALLEKALAGDIRATEALLSRLLPGSSEAELESRLNEIEKLIREVK